MVYLSKLSLRKTSSFLQFRENLDVEDMKFLEEAFVLAGVKDMDLAYEDVMFRTISSLHEALEEVVTTVSQVTEQILTLKWNQLTLAYVFLI